MIRKKIEKAVVIAFAALAAFVFVRGIFLKNKKEPAKETDRGTESNATPTEEIALGLTPAGETPTEKPTPDGETVPTTEPTVTQTPFPTPTQAPVKPFQGPSPVPTLPTPTPVPDGIEEPGYDDRELDFMDVFLDNGYETLYDFFSMFRKTETTLELENARMRKRTEYLFFRTPYEAPAVVYMDEYYTTDESDISEKHVHYRTNANDEDEPEITVFHSHKNEAGEWIYDMLLPDGTTVQSFEKEIIAIAEGGELPLESALAGIIRFENRRFKEISVDGRFAFTITLSYEDYYTTTEVPEPYRSFDIKVWFLAPSPYEFRRDEKNNPDDRSVIIEEIKETIRY